MVEAATTLKTAVVHITPGPAIEIACMTRERVQWNVRPAGAGAGWGPLGPIRAKALSALPSALRGPLSGASDEGPPIVEDSAPWGEFVQPSLKQD
jgi:hypothetical protein